MNSYKEDIPENEKVYGVHKYIEILIKNNRVNNQRKSEATRIGANEVKELLRERKIEIGESLFNIMTNSSNSFGRKEEVMKIITLHDLLKYWSELFGEYEQNFEILLMKYENDSNSDKSPIISNLVRGFKA